MTILKCMWLRTLVAFGIPLAILILVGLLLMVFCPECEGMLS